MRGVALPGGTMRTVLLTIPLLVAACDPCHGWEEIEYIDKAQVDDGEAMELVREAVDHLAYWTGRDQTCVGKVKLVEELRRGRERWSGRYSPRTGTILIDHKENEWNMVDTTLHEFCHAIDYEEGLPSLDNVEILKPWTEDISWERYPTEQARTKEAFANICAEGPALNPLWRQYAEHCGEGDIDPAVRMVHELLYWQWDSETEIDDFAGNIELWEIAGLDDFGFERSENSLAATTVASADGLVVLDMIYEEDADGNFQRWRPALRRIDPRSASVVEALPLEPVEVLARDYNNNPVLRSHELLGSSGDPILYDRNWPNEAWRVRGDPLEIEPIPFPLLPPKVLIRGFEHRGHMLARVQTAETDGIYTASLKDETWTPVDLSADARFTGHRLMAFDADEQGGVLLLNGPDGLTVAAIDLEGQPLWHAPLGIDHYSAPQINRLPDGSVVVMGSISLSLSERAWFPLRYDPITDTVSAPTSDCGTLRYYLDTVQWDGEQWGVLRPWMDDHYAPLSLMRLDVAAL